MDAGLGIQIVARAVVGVGVGAVVVKRIRAGRTRGLPGAATVTAGSVSFASLVSVPIVMDDAVSDWIAGLTGVQNISSWASVIGYQMAALGAARVAEAITTDNRRGRLIDRTGVAVIIATATAYFTTETAKVKSYGIVSDLDFDTLGNAVFLLLFYGYFVITLARIAWAGTLGITAVRRGPLAVTFALMTAGALSEAATVLLILAKQTEAIDAESTAPLRETLLSGGAVLLAGSVVSYNWQKINGRLARHRRLRNFVSEWSRRMGESNTLSVLTPSARKIWSASATSRTAGQTRNRLADVEDALRASDRASG